MHSGIDIAGLYQVEALLEVGAQDLLKIRNLGNSSLTEIVDRMRKYGFDEWADRVNKERCV